MLVPLAARRGWSSCRGGAGCDPRVRAGRHRRHHRGRAARRGPPRRAARDRARPRAGGAARRPSAGQREDVDVVRFAVGVRGYRMDEVDDVLDRLAVEVAERDARIAELEQRLAVPRRPAARARDVLTRPSPDLVVGDDGLARCPWGASTPDYVAYHDTEWGRPVHGDVAIFERHHPRGVPVRAVVDHDPAQARRASAPPSTRFDLAAVAAYGEADRARLLADAGDRAQPRQGRRHDHQRPRRSSGCSTRRARARSTGWSGRSPRRPAVPGCGPSPTCRPARPSPCALAKELKRRGFVFVGPTTMYAAMQAMGLVDDHLAGCAAGA